MIDLAPSRPRASAVGLLLSTIAVLAWLPGSLSAQTESTGTTPGGATYSFLVPDGWAPSDGLLIWNHGYDYEFLPEPPTPGPLTALALEQGYAVAASSYSLPGWALFSTEQDLRELWEEFVRQFGTPDPVLVYGGSLGGLVTAQTIERAGIEHLEGALIACGATAGSRVWDGAADLRLIYDWVCKDVPGAQLPGGLGGLPLSPESNPVFVQASVNLCTGIDLPPELRTSGQKERLERILELAQIPEEFFVIDMAYATYALTELIRDPRKMNGAEPLGNVGVVYPDPELDAGIERVASDPVARQRLLEFYTPSGAVGDAKIVSIHTDKDGLVVVENQTEYASFVPADNLATAVVVEDEPSHCGFSDAEVLVAWESLRSWVDGGEKPTATDLQAACQAAAGDEFPGPCRYDPTFVPPPFEERILPRPGDPVVPPNPCSPSSTQLCLNGQRFAVTASYRLPDGTEGTANAEPLTDATGWFWFLGPSNAELFVKVLDGCVENDHYWVFVSGLTNLEVDIVVEDRVGGQSRSYSNPGGVVFETVTDTQAFATCDP